MHSTDKTITNTMRMALLLLLLLLVVVLHGPATARGCAVRWVSSASGLHRVQAMLLLLVLQGMVSTCTCMTVITLITATRLLLLLPWALRTVPLQALVVATAPAAAATAIHMQMRICTRDEAAALQHRRSRRRLTRAITRPQEAALHLLLQVLPLPLLQRAAAPALAQVG